MGKKVELEIIGVEGEMDWIVLEWMVLFLEYMLCNVVDYGLEMLEECVVKNKKEIGCIIIYLVWEGGEVVLCLIDDGKGINLDGVKNWVIECGLMKVSVSLIDKEIM